MENAWLFSVTFLSFGASFIKCFIHFLLSNIHKVLCCIFCSGNGIMVTVLLDVICFINLLSV